MRRESTSRPVRSTRPSAAAAVALLGLVALTACGGRTDSFSPGDPGSPAPNPSTSSEAPTTTGETPSGEATASPGETAAPPLGTIPSAVPGGGTSLQPTVEVTATPKSPVYPDVVTATSTPAQKRAAISASYDTFLVDLTGLLATFSPVWQNALAEVATPQMTLAATRAAVSIQNSQSHTVGSLRDSIPTRAITIKGNEALLTSCLDEKSWYAVKNKTGAPDPGITRGYFVGRATFVFVKGRWFVNTWNSLPQRCTFNS